MSHYIEQSDLNRSIFSLIKRNNGLFKSLPQFKFLSSFHRDHCSCNNSETTGMACKGDFNHVGDFFYLEGVVNFTPSDYHSAGRGQKAWGHACFFDGKGIVAQYKVKYYGNMLEGTGPVSAELIWERSTDIQGEDFLQIINIEKAKREEANKERLENCSELEEGRYEITGKIISAKYHENQWGCSEKITVELENGNRIWGTLPKKISFDHNDIDELKGKIVKFTATITPKESGFGFFKRPSKASFII